MFGHQDDQTDTNGNDDVSAIDASVAALSGNEASAPADNNPALPVAVAPELPETTNDPVSQDPVVKGNDTPNEAVQDEPFYKDSVSPAGGFPTPPNQKLHNFSSPSNDDNSDSSDPSDDDLAAIKIQALDELYPLFDKLDLEPDEKFRTLMMMIQASDNQDLIKLAYEAAHNISDEKEKAQALLDIVNEINYFTQHPPIDSE